MSSHLKDDAKVASHVHIWKHHAISNVSTRIASRIIMSENRTSLIHDIRGQNKSYLSINPPLKNIQNIIQDFEN